MGARLTTAFGLLLSTALAAQGPPTADAPHGARTRLLLEVEGWEVAGDLTLPDRAPGVPLAPGVLLLNKAAGNRTVYEGLARELAERGLASLRLDLRGHGESINRGRFVPYSEGAVDLLAGTEHDIVAGLELLGRQPGVDPGRLGVVGASYSGELAVEAARISRPARAYALLSPGSLSDESIALLETRSLPWLFVRSHGERPPSMAPITAAVRAAPGAEVLDLPGAAHGTDLLAAHPDLAERLAVWLADKLR